MATTGMSLVGVNLSGAEFGGTTGRYGYNYIYPTHGEIDYYASKNLNVIRLPFRWERLQPTLDGPLDPSELGRIKDIVSYAATKGMTVILDPHDYGAYDGQLIGSARAPNSAFANFWGQLAAQFKDSSNVIFGLMNEPHLLSATSWLASANGAIAAIRASGAHQEVLVPGSYWDGAASWTTSDNADVVGTGVVDPANNYAFEVHQYLDSNSSGTHDSVVGTSIGVDRLTAITTWAERTGARLFLGEFGVGQDATSLTAMNNMLSYMNQHADVWQGATYWGAGPWWGDYMYSIEPSAGVDKPQMAILAQYALAHLSTAGGGTAGTAAAPQTAAPTVMAALKTDSGQLATDKITSHAALSGSGDANAVVHFTIDGVAQTVTTTADAMGAWRQDFSTLADGPHTITARETNAGGTGSALVALTLDTKAPLPAITSAGGLVATAGQTIKGIGEAGSTVALFDGTKALGPSVKVAADGTWSAPVILSGLGSHAITATDTDTAGNVGTSSAITTVYDHNPTFVSGGGGITASYAVGADAKQIATIRATDSDAGDTVSYALLGGNGNPSTKTGGFAIDAATGALSFDGKPTMGVHSIAVMASDRYGGSAVQTVKVNVTPSNQLAAAGLGPVTQPFVFDAAQPFTLVQNFQAADVTANGKVTPHSVLTLAYSLFKGAAPGSPSTAASLIASHSVQVGRDTILHTDKGQVIDLAGVNRQTLLANPADIALV